ncbi:hypothetical protein [Beijerinckia mobilis]|uniref:hypothetical protein n=1 Tax=Beijerinckia mobilis TaxID=231434 RepID=UPI000690EF4B|nr:hypothetical protein [Beijerinckia mobilis]
MVDRLNVSQGGGVTKTDPVVAPDEERTERPLETPHRLSKLRQFHGDTPENLAERRARLAF